MTTKLVHAQKHLFREVFLHSCGRMGPNYRLATEFSSMIYVVLVLQAYKMRELFNYRSLCKVPGSCWRQTMCRRDRSFKKKPLRKFWWSLSYNGNPKYQNNGMDSKESFRPTAELTQERYCAELERQTSWASINLRCQKRSLDVCPGVF